MENRIRLLFIEDSESDMNLVLRMLKKAGYETSQLRVETAEVMRDALGSNEYDIIICDNKLPEFNAEMALDIYKETGKDIPVIIVSGSIGEEHAVNLMRRGANDYIMKGNIPRLLPAIERELSDARLRREKIQADIAVREARDQHQNLLNAIPDMIFRLNASGEFIDYHADNYSDLIMPPEMFIGKNYTDILPPDIASKYALAIKDSLTTGKISIFEYDLENPVTKALSSYEARIVTTAAGESITIVRNITEMIQSRRRFEQEKYFSESIIETLPGIFYVINSKGEIIRWNRNAVELLEYPAEELAGKNILSIIEPADRENVVSKMQGVFSGNNDSVEAVLLTKTGRPIFFYLTGKLIIIEKIEYLIGVGFDITERKAAEKAVVLSNERFINLVNSVTDYIYSVSINEDGSFSTIHGPGSMAITGYTPEEYDQYSDLWYSMTFEDDRGIIDKQLDEIKSGSEKVAIEHRIICKNGSIKWLRNTQVRRLDEHGNFCGYDGLISDITEKKTAEQEIEKYRDHLEIMVKERTHEIIEVRDRIAAIIRSVSDGIVVTDINQRIIMMNRAAEELLKTDFSSLQGEPLNLLVRDGTLRERLNQIINGGIAEYEFDFTSEENIVEQAKIFHAKISYISDKVNNRLGTVTVISDVTREREIDREKTEFISAAAHELRTPLTSIQGFSEILLTRDNITGDNRKKYLTYINEQSVKLANIVNDLLDISRIESGEGFSLNIRKCTINDIVDNIITMLKDITEIHYFKVNLPAPPVSIEADCDKIEQVLKNLINNSIKYAPLGGLIALTGEIIDDYLHISVEDHGIGMTSSQMERVFEKFYRVDASDAAPEGTGLGMSIVKYIVEAHGGRIRVESELGEGTKVTFTIPLTSPPPAKSRRQPHIP